jgi:hypothetical protein
MPTQAMRASTSNALLPVSNDSVHLLPLSALASASASRVLGDAELAVEQIEHVEAPSSREWVITAVILTGMAALLFLIEVMRVDWAETFRLARQLRSNQLRRCDATSAESTPGTNSGSAAVTGKGEVKVDADDSVARHSGMQSRVMTFAMMLLVIAGSDLYMDLPTSFFSGEVQAAGITLTYSGFYLASCRCCHSTRVS